MDSTREVRCRDAKYTGYAVKPLYICTFTVTLINFGISDDVDRPCMVQSGYLLWSSIFGGLPSARSERLLRKSKHKSKYIVIYVVPACFCFS